MSVAAAAGYAALGSVVTAYACWRIAKWLVPRLVQAHDDAWLRRIKALTEERDHLQHEIDVAREALASTLEERDELITELDALRGDAAPDTQRDWSVN